MSDKWKGNPKTSIEAQLAIKGKVCLVCGKPMLLAIIRSVVSIWKVHCNHCGSEVPIVVMLNRKAWKL